MTTRRKLSHKISRKNILPCPALSWWPTVLSTVCLSRPSQKAPGVIFGIVDLISVSQSVSRNIESGLTTETPHCREGQTLTNSYLPAYHHPTPPTHYPPDLCIWGNFCMAQEIYVAKCIKSPLDNVLYEFVIADATSGSHNF